MDEIRPEMLKALDVIGPSQLTCFFSVVWRSGTVPMKWQTGVVVPIFKKGNRRVGFTVCSRLLEKRLRPTVEPQILEEQCGFCAGPGTSWEHSVHMCIEDLETVYHQIHLGGILCGVLQQYRVPELLLRAIRSWYN